MPIKDQHLIVEPRFPNGAGLASINAPDHSDDEGWILRNSWYSYRWRCRIHIMQDPQGRIVHGKTPAVHAIDTLLQTVGCTQAWGIEQESRALELLGQMLRHHNFRQYLLTGMFLEKSERSGIYYLFRRLKPTIAMSPRGVRDNMRVLCGLCMHPIAYYAGSWAGAMTPTDDVIAHLALMRGDEHMFWKRCNQHPPHLPESGL